MDLFKFFKEMKVCKPKATLFWVYLGFILLGMWVLSGDFCFVLTALVCAATHSIHEKLDALGAVDDGKV